MPIEQFGKGGLPDPPDSRDYTITNEALGASQVQWSPDFTPSKLLFWNQGQSLSCGSAATSYYAQKLHTTVYSKHDLYSRVFVAPAGGSYARDNILQRIDPGQSLEVADPDPDPPTEAAMRLPGHGPREISDRNGFIILDHTIDGIAAAIDLYDGVIFGLYGTNPGWQDLENPRPPASGETIWAHLLYAEKHHLHDGVKCILAVSTWAAIPGTTNPIYHHIKANYFESGNTFNPWTLIPKDQVMPTYKKVKIGANVFGVAIITPNGTFIVKAIDEAEWRSFSQPTSYQLHTVNQDRTTDYSVDIELPDGL